MKNNDKKRPIIGIVFDREEKGDYSTYPYYALRQNYFDSVFQAGGLPIGLLYHLDAVQDYINEIDGLIIAGGNFDIPPEMYGSDFIHETVTTKNARTNFEFKITAEALKADLPILGICGGEQLINVVCGGSLVQDIASEIPGALQHEIKNREAKAHDIAIVQGSLLHKIAGRTLEGVNSSHHQAVKDVGKDMIISAVAPDGVVEAIEHKSNKFCLGVQWHPEYLWCEFDKAIFKKFIEAASN